MANSSRPRRASGQPARYKDFVPLETSDGMTTEEDKPQTSKEEVSSIADDLKSLKAEIEGFGDGEINKNELDEEALMSGTGSVPRESIEIVAIECNGVFCEVKKEKPSITVEKTSESHKIPQKPRLNGKIHGAKTNRSPQVKDQSYVSSASNVCVQASTSVGKNSQDSGPSSCLQNKKSQKKSPQSMQLKLPLNENDAGKKENGIRKLSLPKPSFTKTVAENNSSRQINIGINKASLSKRGSIEDMNSNMMSSSKPKRAITADMYNNNTAVINQNDDTAPEKPSTEELFQYLIEQLSALKASTKMDFRKVLKRLENIEDIIARELSSEFPTKPDCLPLKSRQDLTEFENVSGEMYRNVVTYLGSFSIGSLADTARIVVKNGIADSLSPELTWQGGEPGTVALGQTKFAKALYAATARNKTFEKPQWQAFCDAMYGALKASKQRHANAQAKLIDPAKQPPTVQRRGRQRRRIELQDLDVE